MPLPPPPSGGASLTVNSGNRVNSGLLPLQIAKQAIAQPSGIPEPLPPMFGFLFPNVYSRTGDNHTSGEADLGLNCLCAGRTGAIWVGLTGAVYRTVPNQLSTITTTKVPLAGATVRSICSGPDGNIWAADFSNKRLWKIVPGVTQAHLAGTSAITFPLVIASPNNVITLSTSQLTMKITIVPGTYTTMAHLLTAIATAIIKLTTRTRGPTATWITATSITGGTKLRLTFRTSIAAAIGATGNGWHLTSDLLTSHLGFASGTPLFTGGGAFAPAVSHFTLAYAPKKIIAGPDGALWVTLARTATTPPSKGYANVQRYSTTGVLLSTITTGRSGVDTICAGPDGNVYILDQNIYQLTKITVPTLKLVTVISNLRPGTVGGMAAGADGNLWIGWNLTTPIPAGRSFAIRITSAGVVTSFAFPGITGPLTGLAAGAGGDLWYIRAGLPVLWKVTVEGAMTPFALGGVNGFTTPPTGIIVGPDGGFWMTASNASGDVLWALPFYLQLGNILFTALPSSDPGIAGVLWRTAGAVKVSAG